MSRIRSVKPSLFSDEKLCRASIQARYLYIGLFTESDDYGRQLASSKRIAGALFPHDDKVSPVQVTRWLGELERLGRVVRYRSEGIEYLYLPKFLDHQKIQHPTDSKLPDPPVSLVNPSERAPESLTRSSGGPHESLAPVVEVEVERGSGSGSGEDDGFENFWNAYPRKVEKAGARRKFDSLLAGGADPEEIIAGAARYAADPNREDGYTKHPTTWLNNGCWSDAAIPSKVSASGNVGNILALADRAEGA